jgi:hypothetical protein
MRQTGECEFQFVKGRDLNYKDAETKAKAVKALTLAGKYIADEVFPDDEEDTRMITY